MAYAVNLVVGCSNRKRYDVAPGLAARELRGDSIGSRIRAWQRRLTFTKSDEYPARHLYMGDHWSVAQSIPIEAAGRGLAVRLWICSAGYGLIEAGTPIKPYCATFAPGTEDFIASGISASTDTRQAWWAGVCEHRLKNQSGTARSLCDLARRFPRTPIIVALSKHYLAAVRRDLEGVLAQTYFRDHLAIVSCGSGEQRRQWAHNLLPCDGGMSTSLGGSLISLNVRVVRFLCRNIGPRDLTVDNLTRVARLITRCPVTIASRHSVPDDLVVRFIRSRLRRNSQISKSRLLSEFRRAGRACEQTRFGELFAKANRDLELRTDA